MSYITGWEGGKKNRYLESNCGALNARVQNAFSSILIPTNTKSFHFEDCERISLQLTLSMQESLPRHPMPIQRSLVATNDTPLQRRRISMWSASVVCNGCSLISEVSCLLLIWLPSSTWIVCLCFLLPWDSTDLYSLSSGYPLALPSWLWRLSRQSYFLTTGKDNSTCSLTTRLS